LLGLVRSEIGAELLPRASALLLADRARLLRELIRTVIAVEVQPASKLFAASGLDPAIIPPSLDIPRGPSWQRLIMWLLSLGDTVPPAAVPDVVNLYTTWSSGMFGLDPLTPFLLRWLYHWLRAIEAGHDEGPGARRSVFGCELDYEEMNALESDLRIGFLLFCNKTPELAAQYLQSQRRDGQRLRTLLKFRGTLAQAAPAELAELTATSLIAKPEASRLRPTSRHEI
jgi:hypothetical protein